MILHQASDACRLKLLGHKPGKPSWANLTASMSKEAKYGREDFKGPGVYACFFDSQLIYIGKYQGLKSNHFGGNVMSRILNHLIGFTFRARHLGMSQNVFKNIVESFNHNIAKELAAFSYEPFANQGISVTARKANFIASHWATVRDADPVELMKRFSFTYKRLDPNLCSELKSANIVEIISGIEKHLITHFQPVCNSEFRTSDDEAPSDFNKVAIEIEKAFAKQLGLELPQPTALVALVTEDKVLKPLQLEPESAEFVEDELQPLDDEFDDNDRDYETWWPEDPRWHYRLVGGPKNTLHLRAYREKIGRDWAVLMVRYPSYVQCRASVSALRQAGIEAIPANDAQMVSKVRIADWSAPETPELMRKVLETSLNSNGG